MLRSTFIDQVLNLACRSGGDGQRDAVGTQLAELTAGVNRLIAPAEAGAGEVAELATTIKARTAERVALTRRLSGMVEPTDRTVLEPPSNSAQPIGVGVFGRSSPPRRVSSCSS